MTVVIAHGQPKSGSTFLFSTALEIASHVNGEPFYDFRKRVFGPDFQSFTNDLSEGFLREIDQAIGPRKLMVVKTHAVLSPDVATMIEAGEIKAFTSFRDPRDTALSTLNVGEKDRSKGSDRWFATITDIRQLSGPITKQVGDVMHWVRQPGVCAIPYCLIATAEATSVGLLADYLGVPYYGVILAGKMSAQRERLPEFNKGVLDRFVDEFPPEDLVYANEVWQEAIAAYEKSFEEVMNKLGHRLSHAYFTALRDQRLTARLVDI